MSLDCDSMVSIDVGTMTECTQAPHWLRVYVNLDHAISDSRRQYTNTLLWSKVKPWHMEKDSHATWGHTVDQEIFVLKIFVC